jgi:hypothetical protein
METSIKFDKKLKNDLDSFYLKSSESIRITYRKLYNNPALVIPEKYYDIKKEHKLKYPINVTIEAKYLKVSKKIIRAYLRERLATIQEPNYKLD